MPEYSPDESADILVNSDAESVDLGGERGSDFDTSDLANKTKQEILDSLPEDWTSTENNGHVHVSDAEGNVRVRIDPPDAKTKYDHLHISDKAGNPLDVKGNIVGRKSVDAHIRIWND